MKALKLLRTRRSTDVKKLVEPGPSAEELEEILTIATRVPDHGKLAPWKLLLLRRPGQEKLGDLCADLFHQQYPDADKKQREFERARFTRAPLVIAVLSIHKESIKAPMWEQELSAGAVCMNILHACHALGYGAKWLTEWPAYYSEVVEALLYASPPAGEARWGGKPASATAAEAPPSQPSPARGEGAVRIAGFLYIGTKTEEPEDRERPNLAAVVEEWK